MLYHFADALVKFESPALTVRANGEEIESSKKW